MDTELLGFRWTDNEWEKALGTLRRQRKSLLESRHEKVLQLTLKFGHSHPETLHARLDLLPHSVDFRQGLEVSETLATDCKRALGVWHPTTVQARIKAARDALDSEAEELHTTGIEALELLATEQAQRHGSTDHHALTAQRELTRARTRYTKHHGEGPRGEPPAVTLSTWSGLVLDHGLALGANHPDTLCAWSMYGDDCCELGDHQQEADCYAIEATRCGDAFGPSHPHSLDRRWQHLSTLVWHFADERADQIAEVCGPLAKDCIRALGKDHLTTQNVLEAWAQLHHQ
ncbi:hypothetical protein [Kitasatospora sp. LaBMicrA B282]|uniref:hypothetical protein n=1 Tax=Kitasatospora sp. LaBMicrA B282 TaxID=3420949 RepID=UPI003D0EF43F